MRRSQIGIELGGNFYFAKTNLRERTARGREGGGGGGAIAKCGTSREEDIFLKVLVIARRNSRQTRSIRSRHARANASLRAPAYSILGREISEDAARRGTVTRASQRRISRKCHFARCRRRIALHLPRIIDLRCLSFEGCFPREQPISCSKRHFRPAGRLKFWPRFCRGITGSPILGSEATALLLIAIN